MPDHRKAQKHLKAAHAASLSGNARMAQQHAFHAARALSSNPGTMNDAAPDADDMGSPGGPSDASDDDHDDSTPGGSMSSNSGSNAGGNAGSGHFIQGAIKHPGALHRELGVPQGQTIPAKKVEQAAHSSNPTLAKRARLAETLKSLNHSRRGT